jgi:hypothetical protein
MATQQPISKQITINTADEMSRGRFSNTMFVAHSPEEFVIDWMNNSPNGMHLVSRIIVTPGHMKRILAALSDNMSKYEEKYGSVTAIDPSQQKYN